MTSGFGFKPHPAQLQVLRDRSSNIVVAASRRFGKTMLAKASVLETALAFPTWIAKQGNPDMTISRFAPAVVAIACPTFDMARDLYYRPLKQMLLSDRRMKQLVDKFNDTRLSIDFVGNRPSILCGGANHADGDTWRGKKIVKLVIDEVQDVTMDAITKVFRPALADTVGSQALYIGTPKGKLNTLYYLKELADDHPDLYSFYHFTAWDNPYFSRAAIEAEQRTLTPAVFEQEYCATFANHPAKFFVEMTEENLVDTAEVPVRFSKTFLGVDHGQMYLGYTVWGIADNKCYFLEGWKGDGKLPVTQSEFHTLVLDAVDRFATPKYKLDAVVCDSSEPGTIQTIATTLLKAGYKDIPVFGAWKDKGSVAIGQRKVHDLLFQKRMLIPDATPDPNAKRLPKGSHVTGQQLFDLFASYNRKIDKQTGEVLDVEAPGNWELIDTTRYIFCQDPAIANSLVKERRWDVKNHQRVNPKNFNRIMDDDPRLDPESLKFCPIVFQMVKDGYIKKLSSRPSDW